MQLIGAQLSFVVIKFDGDNISQIISKSSVGQGEGPTYTFINKILEMSRRQAYTNIILSN